MQVRLLLTNLKMTVRADGAVLHVTRCSSACEGSRPLDGCPSPFPSQLLASEIKQTCLSTNLAGLTTCGRRARGTTHSW